MAISQLLCSTGPPRKRDSSWSWLVCACATMSWVATLGFVYSFGVFLPVFMDYFKASRETTAWVGSLAIAQYCFLGQLSTTLTTRFGARITSMIGGTICAVSLVASSFVEDILVLFFTYSIPFGFGCSCTYSSSLCVMGQYFKKRLSLATGVLTAGEGAGVLIFGPTLQPLLTATSWQVTYRIMAGVVFVLCSVAVTFDPNVETDGEGLMENQGATEEINEGGNTKSLVTSLKEVFDVSVWKEPRVVAFMLSDFVTAGGILVPRIHLVRYCEELGISAEKSSELLIYYGLFSAFGRSVGGILCNHPRVDALSVFQSAEIVIGLSTILVSLAATYYPLVIFAVIYGLCEGFFACTLRYLLVSVSPRKTTAVLGWNMLLVSFFLASGPPLAGLLADKLGSYVVPFRVAGGITIAGAFIPFTLLCRKRSDRIDPKLQNDEDENLLR